MDKQVTTSVWGGKNVGLMRDPLTTRAIPVRFCDGVGRLAHTEPKKHCIMTVLYLCLDFCV